MKKVIAILILASSLQGCAIWDFIKPSSGISVDTEIVAGDKQQDINTEVSGEKTETHNKADIINQVFNPVKEKSNWISLMVVTGLGWLVGWITKTPLGMIALLRGAFRRKGNGGRR